MELISLWRSGCSPFDTHPTSPNSNTSTATAKCSHYTERGIATLQQKLHAPPAIVLLGGYWTKLIHGQTYSEFVKSGEITDPIATTKKAAQLKIGLSEILRKLQTMSVSKILLVGPSGELVYSPLDCVLRAKKHLMSKDFAMSQAQR